MKFLPCLHTLGLAAALVGNVASASHWETSSYTGLGYIDEGGLDDSSFSSSFSVVYRFSEVWGIEGGYTSFGDFKSGFDLAGGRGQAQAEIDGFSLGLNYRRSINESWYVTSHAGLWGWRSDGKIEAPGVASVRSDDDGTDAFIGAGFGYMFTQRWGAGLGFTWYGVDANGSGTSTYIVGLNTSYLF